MKLGGELSLFDSISNEEANTAAATKQETVLIPNSMTDSILQSSSNELDSNSNSNANNAKTLANSNTNTFSDLSGAIY